MHSVESGPASQSYGLQVAALAGIPRTVLNQASKHLALLEKQQRAEEPQLGLFDQPAYLDEDAEPETAGDGPLRQKIEEIDPDTLTPREALVLLYELKEL